MTLRRYRDPKQRQRIRDLRRAENCERKTHFETREDAQAMRTEMTHGNNSQLAIYVCPICGKFVLGADKKRARRMR